MKSFFNSIKYLSLLISALLITLGLIAQSRYANCLALNSNLCLKKTISKVTKPTMKLAEFEENFIPEKHKNLEDWMFNISCKPEINEDSKTLEPWMFDSQKWKIQKNEWNIEPPEEALEIEPWMLHIESFRVNQSAYIFSRDIHFEIL